MHDTASFWLVQRAQDENLRGKVPKSLAFALYGVGLIITLERQNYGYATSIIGMAGSMSGARDHGFDIVPVFQHRYDFAIFNLDDFIRIFAHT